MADVNVDDLLEGSIDLHAHGYPEVGMDFEGPGGMQSCLEWAMEARDVGMGGFLIKSHFFPSVPLAQNVDAEVDGIDVYGSTVLNPTSGGIDPLTAEIGGRLGSGIVYMPTWSASHDIECGGFSSHVSTYYDNFDPDSFDSLCIVDDDGDLKPEVHTVLDELAHFDVTVGTGHISPEESLTLADETADRGLSLVFDHPTSGSTNATVEQTKAMAERGAYVEFVALGTVGRFERVAYDELASFIRDIGVDHCLVSTDAFSADSPSPPELMRRCLDGLAETGFSTAELQTLVQENPRDALGAR